MMDKINKLIEAVTRRYSPREILIEAGFEWDPDMARTKFRWQTLNPKRLASSKAELSAIAKALGAKSPAQLYMVQVLHHRDDGFLGDFIHKFEKRGKEHSYAKGESFTVKSMLGHEYVEAWSHNGWSNLISAKKFDLSKEIQKFIRDKTGYDDEFRY